MDRAPLLPGLLLLALVPLAAAQDPLALRVDVEPLPSPVPPLKAPREVTVSVDAPCVAPGSDPSRARINLWLDGVPSWARAALSPASLEPDPAACQNGRFQAQASLVVTATEKAPAFTPAPLTVHASWEGAAQNLTGSAPFDVVADWFSILDVQLAESVKQVGPGATADFPIVLANHGNDRTRVTFELVEEQTDDHLSPVVPEPVVLESTQKGGAAATLTVPLEVRTSAKAGYSNQVGVVTYRILAHHADRPDLEGDGTTVSMLVTVKGFHAPAPGPAPLLGALLAAAAGVGLRRAARRR